MATPEEYQAARRFLSMVRENPEAALQKYGAVDLEAISARAQSVVDAGEAPEIASQVSLDQEQFAGDKPTKITLRPDLVMGGTARLAEKATREGSGAEFEDTMRDESLETNASKLRALNVPPRYVPEGSKLTDIMTAGWDEPSLDEFHATFPHYASLGEDSIQFKLFADQKWARDYAANRALGKPIIRTKYADFLEGPKASKPELAEGNTPGEFLRGIGEGTIEAARATPAAALSLVSGAALGADEHIAAMVDKAGPGGALDWVRRKKAESPIASTLWEVAGFLTPGGAAARIGNVGLKAARRALPGLTKPGILMRGAEGAVGGTLGAGAENVARQGLGVATGSQEVFDGQQALEALKLGGALGGALGAGAGAAQRGAEKLRSLPGFGGPLRELEPMGGGLGPLGGPRMPKDAAKLPDMSKMQGGPEGVMGARLGPDLANAARARDITEDAAVAAGRAGYYQSPAGSHGQPGWNSSAALLDGLEAAVDARGVPRGGVKPGDLSRLRREVVQNHEIEAVWLSGEVPKAMPGEGRIMSFDEAERFGLADDMKKIAGVKGGEIARDTLPDAKAFDDALKSGRDTNPDPQFSDTMRSAGGPPPNHFILRPKRLSAKEHQDLMTRVETDLRFTDQDNPFLKRWHAALEADVNAYPASDSRGGTTLRSLKDREAARISERNDARRGAGLPPRSLAAATPEGNAAPAWQRLEPGERTAFERAIGATTDEVMKLADQLPPNLKAELRSLRATNLGKEIKAGYEGLAGVGVPLPGGAPGGLRAVLPSPRRALPALEWLSRDAAVSPSVTQKGASLALKVLPENTSVSPELYGKIHDFLKGAARPKTLPGSTLGLRGGGLAARAGAMKADKDGKISATKFSEQEKLALQYLMLVLPEQGLQ